VHVRYTRSKAGKRPRSLLQLQVEVEGAFGLTIPDVEIPVDQIYFNPPGILASFSLVRLPKLRQRYSMARSRVTTVHTHVPLQTR
jgi:hypothetical protein